jgi:hypothetical protein
MKILKKLNNLFIYWVSFLNFFIGIINKIKLKILFLINSFIKN